MKSSQDKSNGLMGDLESIKALLEEDELEPIPETLSEALNPLPPEELEEEDLEDLEELEIDLPAVPEASTHTQPPNSFDPATGVSKPIVAPNLDELLGDDFHEATAEVMQNARAVIDQHAHQWSPQQTDELADALRVRIDGAVAQWIKTSLDAHALELQQRLLNAVRDELSRHLEAFEHTSE